MPRVLIFGATGFIGKTLSTSLVRSGEYQVYGIARTPEKARELATLEVTPVLCPDPLNDAVPYLAAVKKESIDMVVDASTASIEASEALCENLKKISTDRAKSYTEAGIVSPPKLGFVYVSGTWVHGSSLTQKSDLLPVGAGAGEHAPATLAMKRPALEQKILAARDILDVIVVRPSLVYGRDSWIWGTVLGPVIDAAKTNPPPSSVQIALDDDTKPALVHVEDVATGLHAAIERLPTLAGTSVYPVFDLSTSTESFRDIVHGAAQVLGYEGKIELIGPGTGLFPQALNTSANIDSSRARQLLGWQPKKNGMLKNIAVYTQAFAASRS